MPQIIYDTVLSYNDISKVKSVLWGTADVRLFVGWPLYAAVVLTICLKDLLLFHHWAFSTSWTNCKQHSHSVDFLKKLLEHFFSMNWDWHFVTISQVKSWLNCIFVFCLWVKGEQMVGFSFFFVCLWVEQWWYFYCGCNK